MMIMKSSMLNDRIEMNLSFENRRYVPWWVSISKKKREAMLFVQKQSIDWSWLKQKLMFYIRIGASVHLSLMYEPKRKKENDNSIALQLFLSERENSFHHFSLSLSLCRLINWSDCLPLFERTFFSIDWSIDRVSCLKKCLSFFILDFYFSVMVDWYVMISV